MSRDEPILVGARPASDERAPTEALKLRAADALERALAFAESHGEAISAARARVALRAQPPETLALAVEARQASDGSFAPFPEAASGWLGRALLELDAPEMLRGTLEALALLADAELHHRASAERAVRFVEARQGGDGSFARKRAPEDDRVALTALTAGLLGRSRFVRPEILLAAGGLLAPHWSPDRVEGARFVPLAAFSLYYSNVPDELADEALQWCGRELERGFRSHRFDSLSVMQLLIGCHVGSIPGASFAPEELLERLLDEQAADGGFDELSPLAAASRVGPTIDAMRAIIGLCATL